MNYRRDKLKLDVRCPRCQGHAVFDDPFEFHYGNAEPDAGGRPVHRFANGWIVEKYPAVTPWVPTRMRVLEQGLPQQGVVRCYDCHLVAKHELRWPADAWYQWNVRGNILWAWDAEHAGVLLAFLGGTERDPFKFEGYTRSLRKLPGAFLSAKLRDEVVKEIGASLGKHTR